MNIIKQSAIGFFGPMALFVVLMSAAMFISQENIMADHMFWIAFRIYICCGLFIAFVRGFMAWECEQ